MGKAQNKISIGAEVQNFIMKSAHENLYEWSSGSNLGGGGCQDKLKSELPLLANTETHLFNI